VNDQLQPALRLLRRTIRFWGVGLLAFATIIVATLALALLLPKQYRSEAVLYYREGWKWNPGDGLSARRMGQRLKDSLLARKRLADVIEELRLFPTMVEAGRTGEAVEQMLLATGFKVKEGDVFVISYTGDSPEEAQRVTAKLTDLLISDNAQLLSWQAEAARTFLDAEKKRNETELAAKEGERLRFLSKHPEFLHEQGSIGSALRTQTKTPQAENVLLALRREEQRLRRQIASPGRVPRAPQDPTLLAAKKEAEATLKAAQRELASRRARVTDQHPDARAAAAMVKEAEIAYRNAVGALTASETAISPAELQGQLARVQQDIGSYERKNPMATVPDEAGESHYGAQRVVALEAEWARLDREVSEARERFQQLDSKQFMASMTLNALTSGQTGQIVVIDPAYLPARPIGMSRTRLALMSVLMALTLGIGLAMFLGLVDDRIYDRIDLGWLDLAPFLIEVAGPLPEPVRSSGTDEDERAHANKEYSRETPSLTRKYGKALSHPPGGSGAARAGLGSDDAPVIVTYLPALQSVKPASASLRRESLASKVGPAAARLEQVEPPGEALALRDATMRHRADLPMEPKIGISELARTLASSQGIVRTVHRVVPTQGIDSCLPILFAPDSPAAASFRVLRHRLDELGRGKAVLVTSPSAGEGKTFCALNLALALGEDGRERVLLIEANFRSPSLARLLGFQPPLCIQRQLEYYRAMRVHAWDVVEAPTPELHVAAVAPEGEMSPMLDGPALAVCIEDMRSFGYDHIVIDGPAVLGSADANVIEESVDGILMVLRAGRSRARELRKAGEQIGTSKLLGVALLGT
jgi:Mrp family chromosome partitioning ATPase/uncharacterized protein involved in exopolysaccharide biosynthesis